MTPIIAIEGTDGAGKKTLSVELAAQMELAGLRVLLLTFPKYQESVCSAYIINLLNGRYGPLASIHPDLKILMYAAERFEVLGQEDLSSYDAVVTDRYIASNIAYQLNQLPSDRWLEWSNSVIQLENAVFGTPMPTINFFVDIPWQRAQAGVLDKPHRPFLDGLLDESEKSGELQEHAYNTYDWMVEHSICGTWHRLECLKDGIRRDAKELAVDSLKFLQGLNLFSGHPSA